MSEYLDSEQAPRMRPGSSRPGSDALDYRLLRSGTARLDGERPPEADPLQNNTEEDNRWEMLSRVVEDILIDGSDDITKETQECRMLFQKITGVDPQSENAPWYQSRERKDNEPLYTPAETRVSELLISVLDTLEASGCKLTSTDRISRLLRTALRKMCKAPVAPVPYDASWKADMPAGIRHERSKTRASKLPRTRAV